MQWGIVNRAFSASNPISFPLAFTNKNTFVLSVIQSGTSSSDYMYNYYTIYSAQTFIVMTNDRETRWFAIGY